MIEIPEALMLARQLNETVKGKTVKTAVANASPHKFAWYTGDPAEYGSKLAGKTLGQARAYGGRVEVDAGDLLLQFADGINLRYLAPGEKPPAKHQLWLAFTDGSSLVATISMYGGLWCSRLEEIQNDGYYKVSKESLPPLSDAFDLNYFVSLLNEKTLNMSVKAFLATEQRIPGLGNGVLQDILLGAGVHPRKKMATFTQEQIRALFSSLKETLRQMTEAGGRDTEKDLFGNPGGYKTRLSKNTLGMPCPHCGGIIQKEAYLGGSVYFCEGCQEK